MAEKRPYCNRHQRNKIFRGGKWICPLCIADNTVDDEPKSPVAKAIGKQA
jgi:hypothetical protein